MYVYVPVLSELLQNVNAGVSTNVLHTHCVLHMLISRQTMPLACALDITKCGQGAN